eukprot:11047771-Alexandrium_andersonii.AAC.1
MFTFGPRGPLCACPRNTWSPAVLPTFARRALLKTLRGPSFVYSEPRQALVRRPPPHTCSVTVHAMLNLGRALKDQD